MRLWFRPLAICVGVSLFAQSIISGATIDLQQHLFSQIKGKRVEDQDGAKLGKVQDFIVDVRSSRIKYVVIDSGGILGVRSRQKAVPAYVLTTGSAKKNTVGLYAKKTAWKRTPVFKKGDLAQMNHPDHVRQLSKLYPKPTQSANRTDNQTVPGSTREGSGDGDSSRPSAAELRLATEIVGESVVDRQRQELGTVEDLLVDFSGEKPTLVVVSTRPGDLDKKFAFPLRALTVVPDNRLVLNGGRVLFTQAKPFNEQAWQSEMAPTMILRFAENAKSQSLYELESPGGNSGQQGGGNPDRVLAQRVKQALETDPLISTAALNELKVVAIKGKVTLRGRVTSEREKSQIERTAREIAGSRNVNNQLIVQKQ